MVRFFSFFLLVWSFTSAGAGSQKQGADETEIRRPVTVADAIRMTKLADFGDTWVPDHVAQFSPDGGKFVVVLRKGNLEENTNEYSILLWRTNKIVESPSPKLLLTMASSSNRQAIKDITWLPDNETIAFLGEHPGELQQLYTYHIRRHVLRRLTNHNTNLLSYSITPRGDQIAYTAEEPVSTIFDTKRRREGFIVSTQLLLNLLAGQKGGSYGDNQLFSQVNTQRSRRIETSERLSPWSETPFLSPDGKYIVIGTLVAEVPETWKEYSDPVLHQSAVEQLAPGQSSSLVRYALVDTDTGKSRILLNSPISYDGSSVFWSPDGSSVAIDGVYLSLDGTSGDERKKRQSKTFAVEVNIKSGEVTKIGLGLKLFGWQAGSNRLIVESKTLNETRASVPKRLFLRNVDKWEQDQRDETEVAKPEIVLEQDMNTPPKILALDPVTHRRALLMDLNPQFERLKFTKVEELNWKGSEGHDVKGGLYYPVDYVPGKRYPLVIQTHGWNSHTFWLDGPFTTAFAAQPLAAKNIAVLQVDEDYDDMLTPEELPREMGAFEGAIDYLDKKGIIDPKRVGIIGFSRTCFHTKYALTHSKYRFAAASVTDGLDGGYFQYIAFSNAVPSVASSSESVIGGPPFGPSLTRWLAASPGFSLDRVQTPLLIEAPNPGALLSEWEWFAGLARLGKPVEMIYMQDGDHPLQKPGDRLASQQGNVDWFVFWLKGEEEPDPAKAEQYVRWRELRKLQKGMN
jgi:dipeptidyl aminopeptidase/acylaminoacyl peptidase